MKTSTGFFILVGVAGVLALILWWFAGTVEQNPGATDEDTGMYDTLDLKNSCTGGNWDDCCKDTCPDFCKENGMKSVRDFANNYLCTCWCEQ